MDHKSKVRAEHHWVRVHFVLTDYLDYNATTPLDERVLAAMLPYFNQGFGNASSRAHPYGWDAQEAVEEARYQLASLIHAKPRELIFTSGTTEAINLAIKGIADETR